MHGGMSGFDQGSSVFELRYYNSLDYYVHYNELVGYFSTMALCEVAAKADGRSFWGEKPIVDDVPDGGCGYEAKPISLCVDGVPVMWTKSTVGSE